MGNDEEGEEDGEKDAEKDGMDDDHKLAKKSSHEENPLPYSNATNIIRAW